MRLRAQEPSLNRRASRRCDEPECRRATREGKPFCSHHVDRHPYVQQILAQLQAQKEEIARVRRRGARAVDPDGLTCQEILHSLRGSGPRTLARLARDLNLDASVLAAYVRALARRGKVELTRGKRGGQVVDLAPEGMPRRRAKKRKQPAAQPQVPGRSNAASDVA